MKKNTFNFESSRGEFRFLNFIDITEGKFDFPSVQHNDEIPKDVISFNYVKSKNDLKEVFAHFFVNDYQFERLWTNPYAYLETLKKCEGVIGTDFSCFYDTPRALQIYNVFRNRTLDVFFQKNGIKVIPVVSWSDKESFEWCFEGLPKNSTLAISSNGCLNKKSKELFVAGFNEMVQRLQPKMIVCVGHLPEELKSGHKVKEFNTFYKKFNTKGEE